MSESAGLFLSTIRPVRLPRIGIHRLPRLPSRRRLNGLKATGSIRFHLEKSRSVPSAYDGNNIIQAPRSLEKFVPRYCSPHDDRAYFDFFAIEAGKEHKLRA